MTPRERQRASQLRLDLQRGQKKLGVILQRLQGSSAMMRGSVYQRARRCGKARCRCVVGEVHRDRVLALRRAGKVLVRRLDPVGDAAMEAAVRAWRFLRTIAWRRCVPAEV